MNNYLLDKAFLNTLFESNMRHTYIRLVALTQDELPVEYIEGISQDGSINIDGSSAIRRTCSLTLTTDMLDIHSIYWSLHSKIKVEIGLKNVINTTYDPIIWFPQGVFILTDFKTTKNVNSYTISLTGKDKMCLLNGDISGHFNAETNIKEVDIADEAGNLQTIKDPIKKNIQELVHYYGHEPLHNIIINNVEDYGLEIINNNTDNTYYLWRDSTTGIYKGVTTNDCKLVATSLIAPPDDYWTVPSIEEPVLEELNLNKLPSTFVFLNGLEEDDTMLVDSRMPDIIRGSDGTNYNLFKIPAHEVVGYRLTKLIYDKDLIAKAGDTITSVLDAIVKMLGNFEYFYNLDGQFVFQAKPAYYKSNWSSTEDSLIYIKPSVLQDEAMYEFNNNRLISSIQYNPSLLNIRNDFTIWGERRANSDKRLPFHIRCALDVKPTFYRSWGEEGRLYVTSEVASKLPSEYEPEVVDWRELIYQMARDYLAHNHDEDYSNQLRKNNQDISDLLNTYPYMLGKTGYEAYYHDLLGFWRLLYDPDSEHKATTQEVLTIEGHDSISVTYNGEGWNSLIDTDPTNLWFWFDFYDIDSPTIGQFNAHAIGNRTKVVTDNEVRVVAYPDVPDVIYDTPNTVDIAYPNYSRLTLVAEQDDINENTEAKTFADGFTLSTRKKSAKEVLDNLLYTYLHRNDNVQLSIIPMYHLEPNTLVHLVSETALLNGYYELIKITIPLAYNKTMNLTLAKIPQTIY